MFYTYEISAVIYTQMLQAKSEMKAFYSPFRILFQFISKIPFHFGY